MANAAGAADRLGGALPGAVAYAGIVVGNSSPRPTMPGPAFILQEAVGSPADDAGLQQGDQIIAVAGQSTAAPADVIRLITLHRPAKLST